VGGILFEGVQTFTGSYARFHMVSTPPIDTVLPPTDTAAADPSDIAGVIAPPPLIYAALFGVGILLDRLGSLPRVRLPSQRVLGAGLLLTGLGLAAWGFRTMGKAGTPVFPTEPTTALVTDGPFRYTRNPGYLGMAIAYKGLALWLGRIGPLLLLPAAVAVMEWGVIFREERYLARKFGAAYRAYRSSVPRWLWWL
jgi:protein-S-isoprenylcysteine O-methyltransferase Ste14